MFIITISILLITVSERVWYMKKINKKGFVLSSSKGFTLIEVVLVLAIGGLIFLLAFIAFQQVSANRRDTQRRADAGRIVAELQNYYGDQRVFPDASAGAASDVCPAFDPSSSKDFLYFTKKYMCSSTEGFRPPSGGTANYKAGATVAQDVIVFTKGTTCTNAASSGAVKIEIGLEKGIACRDITN